MITDLAGLSVLVQGRPRPDHFDPGWLSAPRRHHGAYLHLICTLARFLCSLDDFSVFYPQLDLCTCRLHCTGLAPDKLAFSIKVAFAYKARYMSYRHAHHSLPTWKPNSTPRRGTLPLKVRSCKQAIVLSFVSSPKALSYRDGCLNRLRRAYFVSLCSSRHVSPQTRSRDPCTLVQ